MATKRLCFSSTSRRPPSQRTLSLRYKTEPNWTTHSQLLKLCDILLAELRDLRPRDYVDIQSFIWAIGDDSYKRKPTAQPLKDH